ncbi:type II toxin-antitoxin system prevent-host-death family antitoxin [Agrococcus sp. Marseille-Q4369]|uniref:type II toxin-antitoxin system Phd/YefM family antitoxin n=1 Tax=Agrococcus sp. Marseille-Q4369 TaxID=2810513 RepID=UPI001B8D760E|nr:type II toxin-antitoxin system prevent-host-death family antitoxin [Agrococcus sp. Marseille-Q4369]QUW18500.1 type II toxin-antitoxin system prevent-host-death family antitoxin [Agrococcus sp. Marseille-Q4369]
MESIGHREMRNRSSEVLRAVAAGESFTITNHGTAVARLVPVERVPTDLPIASRRGGFAALRRHLIAGRPADDLEDLRGER